MKTYSFTLSAVSMRRLAGLIGGTWQGFGGTSMGADLLQPFSVFLSTSHSQVIVNSVVDFFDIMGEEYETAIAELDVDAGAVALDQLTIPPAAGRWEDKHGIEYTRSRKLISAEDLLGM